MNDMEILAEIRQLQSAIPRLQTEVKNAAAVYESAFVTVKPFRDALKAAKAAVKAAQARLDELCRPDGEA